MRRYIPFASGEFYHVYNRGIDKNKIFFSKGDWKHFQKLLYICNREDNTKFHIERTKNKLLAEIKRGDTLVDICTYAMMDNHFHLLLYEKKNGGITKFMRKLLTAYAMYMNKKYDRTGPLMCRPFRATHIDRDEYLRWVISYIHMNPVDLIEPGWKEVGIKNKKATLEFLRKYDYSSYQDYFAQKRDQSIILSMKTLPIDISDLEYFSDMLKKEITNGLGGS